MSTITHINSLPELNALLKANASKLVAQQVANGFLAQKEFVQLASECTKLATTSPAWPS
ncbi:hypothetical protein JCM3766R1_005743 [Sporobolomyces carnicolor]